MANYPPLKFKNKMDSDHAGPRWEIALHIFGPDTLFVFYVAGRTCKEDMSVEIMEISIDKPAIFGRLWELLRPPWNNLINL